MTSIYPSSTSSTSSSSTSSANLLRISGMASGIDTDAVVKSMVSSYQAKIDKANQSKQTLQWQQEAYRGIIKDIKGLQDYFDPLSSKYILSGKSLNINTAASNNTSIVSATSSASAKAGTYKVNVSQLATQAKIEGTSNNSLVAVTDLSKWSGQKLDFGTNGSITLSSITETVKDSNSMSSLVGDINKQIAASSTLNGKISASYVKDGTTSYVKFTKTDPTTDITLSKYVNGESGTTVSEISSSDNLTINSGVSSSSLLTSLGFKAKDDTENETGLISFTLTNGTTSSAVSLAVNNSSTVQDLMDAVNSATSGAVRMNIDDNTGKISFQSKGYGTSSNIAITDTSTGNNDISKLGISTTTYTGMVKDGQATSKLANLGFSKGTDAIKFTLNGSTVSLTITDDTTINDLITKVNDATSSAITMSIDSTGKVLFKSNTSPASNIKITNTSTDTNNNILTKLGLTEKTDIGTDALVSITAPGQSEITTTQSSNNFTLNGVTYNLVGVTAADGEASNVTVTANSDTVVNNMKDFIKDYNSVIDTINGKLTEKKDSGYPPLTDAQKQSMSESQITAWEAKAKVGILRNDDYLQSLMTQLRGVFSSPVYSSYDKNNTNDGKVSLSFGQYGTNAIGIDTSTDVTDGGKLVLRDESKLKSAIENNLDDFKRLFIGKSTANLSTNETYIGSEKYNEDGIFKRMDTILRDYVAAPGLGDDGTYSLSGSMNIFVNKQYNYSSFGSSSKNTLPDQVYAQTVNVTKFQTQLKDAQTRYYAKFTALETAMNSLNSQQSSLTSMLGTS